MQYKTALVSLFSLLSLATAAPAEEKRQGGVFYSTQTFYSAGGCTGTADGEATFGGVNLCQSVRSTLSSVVSVNVSSVTNEFPGCSVHFYTDAACTKGDTIGVVNHCEQASAPFLSTNIICPTA